MARGNSFVRRMIEEKGLMGECMTVDTDKWVHMIEMPVLIDFIENLNDKHIYDQIKHNMSMIDFKNGDMMHFMNHLAYGFAMVQNEAMGL